MKKLTVCAVLAACMMSAWGCGSKKEAEKAPETKIETKAPAATKPAKAPETKAPETTTAVETEAPETNAPETEAPETAAPEKSAGIRPEFKEMMDSYEEFFDEYIAFMEKYDDADNPMELMADYLKYLTEYSEMLEKMEDVDQSELSDEELKYYIDVTARIEKKLIDAV